MIACITLALPRTGRTYYTVGPGSAIFHWEQRPGQAYWPKQLSMSALYRIDYLRVRVQLNKEGFNLVITTTQIYYDIIEIINNLLVQIK